MPVYFVTADRGSLSTSRGDVVYLKEGVTINGSIDMRGITASGSVSGEQDIFVQGTVFGAVNDYWTDTSGGNYVQVGRTGAIFATWWGAIQMGGGGNTIVNEGIISSSTIGNPIYLLGNTGAYQDRPTTILNSGLISGVSVDGTQSVITATGLSSLKLTNSGEILAGPTDRAISSSATNGGTVTNTGLIDGDIALSGGDFHFESRYGVLTGRVDTGMGADFMGGSAGDDTLASTGGNDTLFGRGGDDILNGGSGDDSMSGADGDDIYYIDSSGDEVSEFADRGTDLVYTAINNYLLADNVENLQLLGGVLSGSGNDLANRIRGNLEANLISGGAGTDSLYGYEGNDTLDAGAGADRLYGGTGNDTFIVSSSLVRIFESAGEGTDLVQSSTSFTLSDNLENLTLTGSVNRAGTGNALANEILGNSAANALAGLEANDTLRGGAGSDTLTGGLGSDRLYGGGGADRFVYDGVADSTVTLAGRDMIYDFSRAQGDRIDLSGIDAIATSSGNQAFSTTLVSAFTDVAGQIRVFRSGGDTYVQGDVDGDGTADFAIRLDGSLTLQASDFVL